MAPYTTVLPKPLLPIGDIPILEVIVRQLRAAGVTQIHLAVGYLAELLQAYFGDGSRFGVTLYWYREEAPLGTAAPIGRVLDAWQSKDPIPETFLVTNGDLLTDLDFDAFFRRHAPGGLSILVAKKDVKIDLGVLQIEDGRVLDYIEKPVYSFRVSTGLYAFSPAVAAAIPRDRAFDLPDLVRALLRTPAAVRTVFLEDLGSVWLDLGSPDDYEAGRSLFEADPGRFCDRGGPRA
jgi:NDP-sugar pyrophosphorylase family protein